MSIERVEPQHMPSPSWRWDQAKRIATSQNVPASLDPITQAAVQFLTERPEVAGSVLPQCTALAAVAAASEIASHCDLRQAEVNARLVAGQSDAEISERCGISPDVVAAYAYLFMDVRKSLRATDWLQVHVIGSGPQRGFRDDELAEWWAQQALAGGPRAVDYFAKLYREVTQPGEPLALSKYLTADAAVHLNVRAMIASSMIPPADASDRREISDFWLESQKARVARERRPGASLDDLKQCSIDAALAVIRDDVAALKAVVSRLRRKRARDLRPSNRPTGRRAGICPPSHRAVLRERVQQMLTDIRQSVSAENGVSDATAGSKRRTTKTSSRSQGAGSIDEG